MPSMALLLLLVAPMGPTAPVGRNPQFLKATVAVQELLEARQFADAGQQAARLLPRASVSIGWTLDPSAQPKSASFGMGRAKAFAAWKTAFKGLAVETGSKPDIEFVWKLGAEPRVQATWSDGPRVKVAATASSEIDVANITQYGIGLWLGLTDALFPNQAMYVTPGPGKAINKITFHEADNARKNVQLSRLLADYATSKKAIIAAKPGAKVSLPLKPEANVVQGDLVSIPVILSNPGNAPLDFRTSSTCGCVSSIEEGTILPGATLRLDATLDTKEFTGTLHKSLIIYTNAAENALIEVPIQTTVAPRYQWVGLPQEPIPFGDKGAQLELSLLVPKQAPLTVIGGVVEGLDGRVKVQAGPVQNGMQVFKVMVDIDPQPVYGRASATVRLDTGDEAFPQIRAEFAVQKGLIAVPGTIFLRFGPSEGTDFSFQIVGIVREFRIMAVESPLAGLTFTWDKDVRAKSHRIAANLAGNPGNEGFKTTVVVKTDDPEMGELRLPVSGAKK